MCTSVGGINFWESIMSHVGKKHNPILLFALASRKITEAIMAKEPKLAARYIGIVRSHFSSKSELGKQFRLLAPLCLGSQITTTIAENMSSEDVVELDAGTYASVIVDSTLAEAIRSNHKVAAKEADLFLTEISKLCDVNQFINQKIDSADYRIINSVWKLYNEAIGKRPCKTPHERATLRASVVAFLKSRDVRSNKRINESLQALYAIKENKITNLVFRKLIDAYNVSFANQLSESQAIIIDRLIRSGNDKAMLQWLQVESQELDRRYKKLLSGNWTAIFDLTKARLRESFDDFNAMFKSLTSMDVETFTSSRDKIVLQATLHSGLLDETEQLKRDAAQKK